jgi:hypothetical protein
MRKILFLICVLGLPTASRTQTNQASWASLSALNAGWKIQMVEMNSKKYSGTFVSFSDAAIVYQGTEGEHTIQKQDVRRVRLTENKHRLRHILIGAAVGGGVGAGVGAGIGAATFHSCSSQQFCIQPVGEGGQTGIAAVFGLVGGAAVGAITGALVPSHKVIYSVTSH